MLGCAAWLALLHQVPEADHVTRELQIGLTCIDQTEQALRTAFAFAFASTLRLQSHSAEFKSDGGCAVVCAQLMWKTFLSTTYSQPYHAIMQSMQIASRSSVGPTTSHLKCYIWLRQGFTTSSYRPVTRSVLVEATKKDPEELVKRLTRGGPHYCFDQTAHFRHCILCMGHLKLDNCMCMYDQGCKML